MGELQEKVVVLVKALPHVGDKYGETVCCAGLTAEGQWRRLYPIPFRMLSEDARFQRWDWISYSARHPRTDRRPESRHVQLDKLMVEQPLAKGERTRFLNRALESSLPDPVLTGRTLCAIRPKDVAMRAIRKTPDQIESEVEGYQRVVAQKGLFDKELKAFRPCPYKFVYEFRTSAETAHRMTCDDWETSAAFFHRRRETSEEEAVDWVLSKFGVELPNRGVVFALGTHSRWPRQWLLVGVIRLDEISQSEFILDT